MARFQLCTHILARHQHHPALSHIAASLAGRGAGAHNAGALARTSSRACQRGRHKPRLRAGAPVTASTQPYAKAALDTGQRGNRAGLKCPAKRLGRAICPVLGFRHGCEPVQLAFTEQPQVAVKNPWRTRRLGACVAGWCWEMRQGRCPGLRVGNGAARKGAAPVPWQKPSASAWHQAHIAHPFDAKETAASACGSHAQQSAALAAKRGAERRPERPALWHAMEPPRLNNK